MNFNPDRETYITARGDDSPSIVRKATSPPAATRVEAPGPAVKDPDDYAARREARRRPGRFYDLRLARRGANLLGVTIGIAAVWHVSAWVYHGRLPMSERGSSDWIGYEPPVFPPGWLLGLLGFLFVVSLAMMLLGTQDNRRRARQCDPSS